MWVHESENRSCELKTLRKVFLLPTQYVAPAFGLLLPLHTKQRYFVFMKLFQKTGCERAKDTNADSYAWWVQTHFLHRLSESLNSAPSSERVRQIKSYRGLTQVFSLFSSIRSHEEMSFSLTAGSVKKTSKLLQQYFYYKLKLVRGIGLSKIKTEVELTEQFHTEFAFISHNSLCCQSVRSFQYQLMKYIFLMNNFGLWFFKKLYNLSFKMVKSHLKFHQDFLR